MAIRDSDYDGYQYAGDAPDGGMILVSRGWASKKFCSKCLTVNACIQIDLSMCTKVASRACLVDSRYSLGCL